MSLGPEVDISQNHLRGAAKVDRTELSQRGDVNVVVGTTVCVG